MAGGGGSWEVGRILGRREGLGVWCPLQFSCMVSSGGSGLTYTISSHCIYMCYKLLTALLFFPAPPCSHRLPPHLGLRRFFCHRVLDGLPPPVSPLLSPAVGSFRGGSSGVATDGHYILPLIWLTIGSTSLYMNARLEFYGLFIVWYYITVHLISFWLQLYIYIYI